VQQRLQKDAQDKDTLKPRSTEYSKSSSDDAAAATEEAAFDPSRTRPEDEVEKADEESGEVRTQRSSVWGNRVSFSGGVDVRPCSVSG